MGSVKLNLLSYIYNGAIVACVWLVRGVGEQRLDIVAPAVAQILGQDENLHTFCNHRCVISPE